MVLYLCTYLSMTFTHNNCIYELGWGAFKKKQYKVTVAVAVVGVITVDVFIVGIIIISIVVEINVSIVRNILLIPFFFIIFVNIINIKNITSVVVA